MARDKSQIESRPAWEGRKAWGLTGWKDLVKLKPKFKAYDLIARAVSDGVGYGLNRAFKYSDTPSRESLEEHVERAVMNSLDEVIDFEP